MSERASEGAELHISTPAGGGGGGGVSPVAQQVGGGTNAAFKDRRKQQNDCKGPQMPHYHEVVSRRDTRNKTMTENTQSHHLVFATGYCFCLRVRVTWELVGEGLGGKRPWSTNVV